MRKLILLAIVLLVINVEVTGQTRKDLEEQREKTLQEISYVDNLLKETSKERKESVNELNMISRKLNLRESVVKGLQDEISLLNDRIALNNIAIEMMESDLKVLKKDYEIALLSSFRSSKANNRIAYILSAKDFNQGYKRLKYLQQVTKFRRQESEIIMELKDEIEISKRKMEQDLSKISQLKSREEQQKYLLQQEKNKQQKIVKTLSSKESQLKKELEEKKRIAKMIEREINKLIDEERKKSATAELSPELKVLSDNFFENRGMLPWPVDQGVITSRFGLQKHPVLKYVTEKNIDIEITSSGVTPVKSVFRGEVVKVFSIRGANMAVIIKHGKYYTVYLNIIEVKVKVGDKVQTGQLLGRVFNDKDDGDKAVLKFMISEEKDYLDPELWISKKN
ncbi:MAG TPA: peptidoglycan DD-metalloendopeptidase family protein [Bacteroidales bacterium]|jgi:septal ring factor EnvC (AmiA/AmiB activator)|nr:peptidoglycan DD-metalloendopeptidase family protein [Bacteroidales bacterium]OQB58702.1 MAG: AmiB activator [Bacteroidetes bacterium ADurb.Bin145]HNY52551.1 peptidoglycan DD-metalloendopeptidase family protein [Bacteroidales bacterium]HOG56283.1 peptidoglycan DD-metalloendopeptidase family protein [Bacteroidales bacterium]HPX43307.1 peptidoglycan DD-metalloendopeptidase family protein [Bacteroidales bacterium]